MNEILQKRIEKVVKKTACPQCVFYDGGICNNDDDCKLFDDFVGLMTFILQNQWISVDEELPQNNKVVFYIALSEKGTKCYGSAYVFNKEWYSDIDSAAQNYYHYKITHWMPIPSLKGCEE